MTRFLGALLAATAVVLGTAGAAKADPAFPPVLKTDANIPCDVTCLVCHNSLQGGFNQFRLTDTGAPGLGATLKGFGLVYYDPSTLATALAADKAANSDIDHDGVGDVDELTAGTDPNAVGGVLCGAGAVTGPEYGCGGSRIAKGHSVDGVATLFAALGLVAGAAFLRRRFRRQ
jgi:hypothetical protein